MQQSELSIIHLNFMNNELDIQVKSLGEKAFGSVYATKKLVIEELDEFHWNEGGISRETTFLVEYEEHFDLFLLVFPYYWPV